MAVPFQFRYYIVSLSFLPFILNSSHDSPMYYCADWDCQDFISRGKTLLNYAGKTDQHLSFRQNEDIKILSKPIDETGPDWVGMVRRKVGLVPKSMVREDQMGKHISKFRYPLENVLTNAADLQLAPPSVESLLTPEDGQDNDIDNDNATEIVEGAGVEVHDEEPLEPPPVVEQFVGDFNKSKKAATKEKPEKEKETLHLQQNDEVEENFTADFEEVAKMLDKSTKVDTEPKTVDEVAKPKNADVVSPPVEEQKGKVDDNETKVPTSTPAGVEIDSSTTISPEDSSAEVVDDDDEESESESEEEELGELPEDNKPRGATEETPSAQKNLSSESIPDASPEVEVKVSPLEESSASTELPVTQEESKPIKEDVKTADEPVTQESILAKLLADAEGESTTASPNLPIDDEIPTPAPDLSFLEGLRTVVKELLPTTESTVAAVPEEPTTVAPPEFETETEATTTPAASLLPDIEATTVAPETLEQKEQEVESTTLATPEPVVESSPEVVLEELTTLKPEPVENIESTTAAPESFSSSSLEIESTTVATLELEDVEESKATDEVEHQSDIVDSTSESEEEEDQSSSAAEDLPETIVPTAELEAEPPSAESSQPEVQHQEPIETSSAAPAIMSDSEPSSTTTDEAYTHDHTHDHHNHHHHHHDHSHTGEGKTDAESSSFIVIVKHISSTLLSFLPEHLQDTVLDVDDALVFTGIIALTLISICVPYFLIEGFFSVRPLKKKVVELNKSLWKVSTAYENQQEEYEIYKKKALAYDEDKKRVEQLEYELVLLQKLEAKQKEQVAKYQKELKTHKELTSDMQSFLDKEVEKKKKILDEKDKLKTTVTSLKEALRRTTDELQDAQLEASTAVMEHELSKQSNETLVMKAEILEKELNELKGKLVAEVERRRAAEDERDEVTKSSVAVDNELLELKKICMKYEDTVDNLNTEINHKENELMALKETLGEDSPLVDIAEVKAKLVNAEEESTSLHSRVDSLSLENNSLSRNLRDATGSLSTIQKERDDALNRLQVLEKWFKEKEEDLRKAVERYEAEKNIRGKDKDDLVRMIEEKGDENKQLYEQLEAFKEEFEETKQQHRNELRTLEAKSHESWLSLCQAERKAQDARKEAEFLRQKLTSLTKEKEGESEDVNGEVPLYPLITPDMVPLPLPDDTPSYFGLGDGFMPPPPLPLDGEREPHRPAPLGRLSPNYSDLDDAMLSPIRRGARGQDDYSDGDSSESDSPRRRSPRGGWVEVPHDRHHRDNNNMDDRRRRPGPRASSPINHQGFNL